MIEADEPYFKLRTVLRAIAVGAAAFLVGFFALLGIQLLLGALGIAIRNHPGRQAILSTFALQGVAFVGTSLAYLSLTDRFSLLDIRRPSVRGLAQTLGGYVLLLLAWQAIGYLLVFVFHIEPAQSAFIEDVYQQPVLVWLFLLLSLFVVGPSEELLFRGIIQGTMRRALGPVAAIGLSSLFFASIHFSGQNGSTTEVLAAISVVFVLSLVLGSLYELTDDLVVPAVAHGLFNATQFLLAYYQATGQL